jgi:hypothetical protein
LSIYEDSNAAVKGAVVFDKHDRQNEQAMIASAGTTHEPRALKVARNPFACIADLCFARAPAAPEKGRQA